MMKMTDLDRDRIALIKVAFAIYYENNYCLLTI